MSGYIGNIPVPQATQTRESFTATASQTTFNTAGYTPNFLDVFLNGVHLLNGTDYTATNGSDVVLTTGAAASDVVEVISYSTFEVNSQTFTGTTTINSLVMSGAATGTNLTLSGGVYLGGSGAANLLDDYEEGTWTPVLAFSGGSGTISYTNQEGSYTKIGRIVYVNGVLITSSISGNSGDVQIQGLPFTVGGNLTSTSNEGHMMMQYKLGSAVAGKYVGYFLEGTTTAIAFSPNSDTSSVLNAGNIPNPSSLRFNGWYQV